MNKCVNFRYYKLPESIRAMLIYFHSNVATDALYLSEIALKQFDRKNNQRSIWICATEFACTNERFRIKWF